MKSKVFIFAKGWILIYKKMPWLADTPSLKMNICKTGK